VIVAETPPLTNVLPPDVIGDETERLTPKVAVLVSVLSVDVAGAVATFAATITVSDAEIES
jgi:hypothetical protein